MPDLGGTSFCSDSLQKEESQNARIMSRESRYRAPKYNQLTFWALEVPGEQVLSNESCVIGAYRGQELADWCKREGGWELEVVKRSPSTRGFSVQPRRWVVERTFGWLSRSRRLSKDYERKVQTSETLIQVAMIRLLLARQRRGT